MADFSRVCLRNCGSGGVVDVPESQAEAGVQLIVYADQHGGENQVFSWCRSSRRLSPALSSSLLLAAHKDGKVKLAAPGEVGVNEERWVLGEAGKDLLDDCKVDCLHLGSILVVGEGGKARQALTDRLGELTVEELKDEDPHQTWEVVSAGREECARPATSCHLTYSLPPELDHCSTWRLDCSVVVHQSCPASYFCIVGWGPGGYSGIQEVSPGQRVAIFSMWNQGAVSVTEVSHGPGVRVTTFGGEGTGLKAMADFSWEEGEEVTFSVEGEKDQKSKEEEAWLVTCSYFYKGERREMATYRRPGPSRPLSRNGFYSFVEDWEREAGAEGHKVCRRAEFFGQKVSIDKGIPQALSKARFTKVEHGRDKFASGKCFGGKRKLGGGFFLSSGGMETKQEEECPSGICLEC